MLGYLELFKKYFLSFFYNIYNFYIDNTELKKLTHVSF